MAIYSFTDNSLNKVEITTFEVEDILERQLQSAIKQQIDVIAPNCLIISEEFSEWSESSLRIDLLAVDKQGNLVVIELKRTESGAHMELQALRYSAMVSTLTFSQAIEIYKKYLTSIKCEEDAESNLLEFLEPKEDDFAIDVRVVLVSANFSKELTTSVMWLNDLGLDIRCVRLIPYKYKDQILLDIQQIIPLPEAEDYQIKVKKQSEKRKVARKLPKDRTRYVFQGGSFGKGRLVLAVVRHWVSKNKPNDLSKVLEASPQEIRKGGLFTPVEEAKAMHKRQGTPRHFLGEGEVLEFQDSPTYAISNQWGIENIGKFIDHCQSKTIGYKIEEEAVLDNEDYLG